MTAHVQGMLECGLDVDEIGHRTYKTQWLIYVTDPYNDLAGTVYNCPDLPAIGSSYAFGGEVDPWAWCHANWSIKQLLTKEPGHWWIVDIPFSTKFPQGGGRCQDTPIENPLAEPPNLSGSFNKLTKRIITDTKGKPMANSSFEWLPDNVCEVDDNRPTVSIQMNLLFLPVALFAPMVDGINKDAMWGLDKHMVKLSNVSWQRLVYGTCTYYYSVTYEFEVNYNTWDRKVPDYGTRICIGADPTDPNSFIPIRKIPSGDLTAEFLDGAGHINPNPNPVILTFDVYREVDFFTLGIPASL